MKEYLLAIDGSTVATGWAVFDIGTYELIDYGVLKAETYKTDNAKDCANERRKRILLIASQMKPIIENYKPKMAVMEEVPPSHGSMSNSITVLALGCVQGAMLMLCWLYNIPIEYISVSTWHSALDILKSKGSLKKQSIDWVNKKFNLGLIYKSEHSKFNQDNEADAICLGCYNLGNYNKKVSFGRR